jgi:hypothetical protein
MKLCCECKNFIFNIDDVDKEVLPGTPNNNKK